MDLKVANLNQKNTYNKLVSHVMQSWQWGECREKLNTPLQRYLLYKNNKPQSAFQISFHKIPLLNQYVGYLPKGPFPDKDLAQALRQIGRDKNCAFIKIEPDVAKNLVNAKIDSNFKISPKPLFTKYNFVIDLTKTEAELLKSFHSKTRYNIKIAQKHEVKVEERTDEEAFETYLKLYFETTKRQGYHGHNPDYHRTAWQTLRQANMARLLIAYYQPPTTNQPLPVTAWMLLNFKDTLYYPYGGSSVKHKEVMANNLVAWEAIRLGKKMGLKKFDMWGALGPNADPQDPWFGFHDFKRKYGGQLVEYLGSFDIIFNWPIYLAFTFIDRLMPVKIFLLKLVKK